MDGQLLISGGNFASGIVPFLNNSVATFAQQIMVCYDHSLSVGVSKIWLFANFYLQAIQQPNLSFFSVFSETFSKTGGCRPPQYRWIRKTFILFKHN